MSSVTIEIQRTGGQQKDFIEIEEEIFKAQNEKKQLQKEILLSETKTNLLPQIQGEELEE